MNVVLVLLSLVWGSRMLFNILSYVHLWFVKEYRYDRMFIHLKTTRSKQIIFPPLRMPRKSPKTIAVVAGSAGLLLLLFVLLPVHTVIRLLIIDLLTFPITGIVVGILQIPTIVYHKFVIARAMKRLRNHTPMMVIGITGSFGKTSTKEFLATILSKRYKVLKTKASKNSPIAIAETVLKELTSATEVFIVEMGAYKPGEVRSMADMVAPDIGIVTAINAQHQDLFGSIDMTMKAKYELIQGLHGKKIAVVNADNPYTRHMGEQAKQDGVTVWWYTTTMGHDLGPNVFEAQDIEVAETYTSAVIFYKKRRFTLTAHVLGAHQISNILAAVATAVAVGMDVSEAIKAAANIKPFTKTMEPVRGVHGAMFINDTFNNNPDAAKAAIAYLAKSKARKILVFQPMIELGRYASESHKDVGREAARVCDDILLTNDSYYEYILAGAQEVGGEQKVKIVPPKKAALYINKIVKKGDVVLFKGKEAERVLNLCFNK